MTAQELIVAETPVITFCEECGWDKHNPEQRVMCSDCAEAYINNLCQRLKVAFYEARGEEKLMRAPKKAKKKKIKCIYDKDTAELIGYEETNEEIEVEEAEEDDFEEDDEEEANENE